MNTEEGEVSDARQNQDSGRLAVRPCDEGRTTMTATRLDHLPPHPEPVLGFLYGARSRAERKKAIVDQRGPSDSCEPGDGTVSDECRSWLATGRPQFVMERAVDMKG
jgi:hypothetical protein